MRKSLHSRKYQVFVEQLVEARKAAGMTQEQVGEQLGRPQSFVAKYEKGERRIDLVEFLEITDFLGADPHAIIRRVAKSDD